VADLQKVDWFRNVFDAARSFGLDDEEIWQTVNQVCERTPNEIRTEDLEKLIAALAEQIQARERKWLEQG
jgi:chromosome condensin MukBEF complex kleisin-like MukF subunit